MGRASREKRANTAAMKPRKKAEDGLSSPAQQSERSPAMMAAAFKGKALWISLGLIVANAAVYWGVWGYQFVNWDDTAYVTSNLQVQAGLTRRGISWAFTAGTGGNWHPLTWLSHMLDIQLFGLNAGGHHVTNLLLHTITTILLFGLLHAMTGALGRSAFVAGLFAVHPLHVESVAWVAERKDVLSTFLWVLTTWAYFRYVRKPTRYRYAGVAVLFVLGLMSKPMLVTLPFTLLLLDIWPLGRVSVGPNFGRQRATWIHLVREKIPLFALTAVISFMTILLQGRVGAIAELNVVPFILRVENATVAYAAYIGMLVWPARLAALYPLHDAVPAWWLIASLLFLAGASFAAMRAARRHPYVPVGWLWYAGTLVPVIGLIQVGSQAMADRYMYVPSLGLFIIAAWGIPDALAGLKHRDVVLRVGAALALLACMIVAHNQARSWKNSMALWTQALSVTTNNNRAENLMGDVLSSQGKFQEAVAHYTEAVRIRPDFPPTHNGLGNALENLGKIDQAMAEYAEAVRLKPAYPEAQNNLGNAFFNRGRLNEAITHYAEAVRFKPDMPEAYNNLGNALFQQGKVDEAIKEYVESLRLHPDPDVHFNVGLAFDQKGDTKEAIRHFEAALQLDPKHTPSRNYLDRLRGPGKVPNQ